MIGKGKYKNEEKEEWMKLMTIDLMSSEESGMDDHEEVIIVHPLPWLSEKIIQFKETLDLQAKKEKTPQAHRQMKQRVIGSPSRRPQKPGLPSWSVKE